MTYASDQQSARSGSPFWRGIGKGFKVLLRLLVVLILGVGVGAGLYYGVPWIYRTLVRPVQENRVRIVVLEESLKQESERIQGETATLRQRVTDLEVAMTELQETSDGQAQRMDDFDDRANDLQTQLDELADSVAAQEDDLATLETDLTAELEALETELAESLDSEIAAVLDEIDARHAALQTQIYTLMGRQILIQTAQDLLKVHLLVVEENPRAARETVTLAVDHLTRARALMPDQAGALIELETRTQALEALIAQNSYRVRPELEAVWAAVMELAMPAMEDRSPLVPIETPGEVLTSTQTSPVPTPTPTP